MLCRLHQLTQHVSLGMHVRFGKLAGRVPESQCVHECSALPLSLGPLRILNPDRAHPDTENGNRLAMEGATCRDSSSTSCLRRIMVWFSWMYASISPDAASYSACVQACHERDDCRQRFAGLHVQRLAPDDML